MHAAVEAHDVVLERRAAGGHDHVNAQVLAELLADLCSLQRELSRWDQQEGCEQEAVA